MAEQRHSTGRAYVCDLNSARSRASPHEGLAGLAGAQGRKAQAPLLFGAAEALRESIGWPVKHFERAGYERLADLNAIRAGLGEEAFRVAWAEGRVMPLEQAIAY